MNGSLYPKWGILSIQIEGSEDNSILGLEIMSQNNIWFEYAIPLVQVYCCEKERKCSLVGLLVAMKFSHYVSQGFV